MRKQFPINTEQASFDNDDILSEKDLWAVA